MAALYIATVQGKGHGAQDVQVRADDALDVPGICAASGYQCVDYRKPTISELRVDAVMHPEYYPGVFA